ncbi:MAG: hypothetical protein LBS36_04270 [Oscillospiraceae bacterium]|nr:hypothetical protein [Oscillospiraceae bacterium]
MKNIVCFAVKRVMVLVLLVLMANISMVMELINVFIVGDQEREVVPITRMASTRNKKHILLPKGACKPE